MCYDESVMEHTIQAQTKFTRWLPVIIWAGMIFALSSVPNLRASSNTTLDLILRKAAHGVEFAVLGFLIAQAGALPGKKLTGRAFLLTLGLGVAYALSDEWHQGSVATRVSAWRDVAIDSFGVLIGASLANRYFRSQKANTPMGGRMV